MIGTLPLAKDLEKDFTPAQAEALTRALSRTVVEDLVTKADLHLELMQLEMKLTSKIDDVRSEISDVRGEIKDVRGEIKDLKVDIVRWIVGAQIGRAHV